MSDTFSWEEAIARVTAPGTPFALGEAEIRGQKLTVFENTPVSLRAIFDRARDRGDEIFLVYENERISFADLMSRVVAPALVASIES
jgi:hypothetical protein